MTSDIRAQTRYADRETRERETWTSPEVEELSVEEIVDLADVKIAFAHTTDGCDLG